MSARVKPGDWFFAPVETWAKNPPEVFPPLPPEAYAERDIYYHECQCQEHDCTNRVRCSEIEPCAGDHRCSSCDDGSYVCAAMGGAE